MVDNKQNAYKTASISHIFDDEQVLLRSEVIGKIKYVIPVLGGIFITLINNLWLMYIISVLILMIAFLLNNKSNRDNTI